MMETTLLLIGIYLLGKLILEDSHFRNAIANIIKTPLILAGIK
ncbi:hypothetical protein [Bacillus sp. FDAARGOS_1420]|nr:hypothetical protein [Bacillus sp. FDAARGOS_1420]